MLYACFLLVPRQGGTFLIVVDSLARRGKLGRDTQIRTKISSFRSLQTALLGCVLTLRRYPHKQKTELTLSPEVLSQIFVRVIRAISAFVNSTQNFWPQRAQ